MMNKTSNSQIYPLKPFEIAQLLHVSGNIKYLGHASPIYIINLPKRSDRRRESIALMQTLDLDAFIVPGYTTNSLEIRHYHNRENYLFKLTELACLASHTRVWLTIVNRTLPVNNTWAIIFEDDIDLEFDIVNIMKSFPKRIWNDTDLIYLGHCANPPGQLIYQSTKHNYRIYTAKNPSCTHAYAIHLNAAKKLIRIWSSPKQPIDNSIVELVNNHELTAYSVHPPLAIQKPVSKTNPSNVNQIDRQSINYKIKFSIYKFLQWWNGVDMYESLVKSTLKYADMKKAEFWRMLHESDSWKNSTQQNQ